MPDEDLISQYVDRAGVVKETEFFLEQLKRVEDMFNKLANAKITLNGAGTTKETITASKQAQTATEDLIKSKEKLLTVDVAAAREQARINKQLLEAAVKLAASETQEAKALAITREELRKKNAEIKNSIREQQAFESKQKNKKSVGDQVAFTPSNDYERNIHALIKNKAALEENIQAQKELKKSLSDGTVTQEGYYRSINKLTGKEFELKSTIAGLNREIKNQVREEKNVKTSIEERRAALIRLQIAYDKLSIAQRNGRFGAAIKSEIQSISTEVKNLEAETNRFQRNVGNYPRVIGGLVNGLKSLAGAFLGVALVQKAFTFLSGSVDEFNEAEDAVDRLTNALQNAGRSDALPSLQKKAKALAREFKTIDDDEVISVFDKLVTYGKLTENQMDSLLPVIINFAAKQKISLADSASVIIKALEGNGRALKEYGIDLKDTKGSAEAFGVVMTDLAPKVEGAAKAFGATTRGQIQATRIEIDNLKEDIGEKLQPAIKLFYQGVAGIPQLFSSIISITKQGIDSVVLFARVSAAALSFDFEKVKSIKEQIALNNRRIQGEKEYAQAKISASAIAATVEGKSELEQQKILNQNISLRDASAQAYKELFQQGKQLSDEGRKAAQLYIRDQETVRQIELAIAAAKDKRLLGNGGTPEDDAVALKAVRQKFFADELKAEADHSKKLSEIEVLEAQTRINARLKAAAIYKNIIEGQRDVEIQGEIDKLNAVKNKKSSPNELLNATNEFNVAIAQINRKSAFELAKIEQDKDDDIVTIRLSSTARMKDIDKKFNEETLAGLKKAEDDKYKLNLSSIDRELSRRTSYLSIQRDSELIALEEKHKAGKISDEKYQIERLKIETEYNRFILLAQIEHTKKLIALKKIGGEELLQAEKDIKAMELQIAQSSSQQQTKEAATEEAALIKKINLYRDVALALADLASGIAGATTDREKNKIQDEIDDLEKKRAKEIEVANQTISNEQDKAAAIQVIEARSQAKKEALERKQRQLDQERARFEKAAAIARIILNTAASVTTFLVKGSIPEAIAAGVIGAAELAVAIATPIPRYAKGTDNHPGGSMITGDGGRKEFVLMPSGDGYVTGDRASVGYAPKGTKVFPDADKMIDRAMRASMRSLPDAPVDVDGYGKHMTAELGRKLDTLNTTIKNKREIHANATHSGITLTQKHLNNWLQYVDQQINF